MLAVYAQSRESIDVVANRGIVIIDQLWVICNAERQSIGDAVGLESGRVDDGHELKNESAHDPAVVVHTRVILVVV